MTEGTYALVSCERCALEASAHWLLHRVICTKLMFGIKQISLSLPLVRNPIKTQAFVSDNGAAITSNTWNVGLQSQKGC